MEAPANIVTFPRSKVEESSTVVRLRDRKPMGAFDQHVLAEYIASKRSPPASIELLLALVEVLEERTPSGRRKRGSIKRRLFERAVRKLQEQNTPGRLDAVNALCGHGGGAS